MRFLPWLLILIGLVILMAGGGRGGARLGRSITLVIVGLIVLTGIFFLVVDRG